MTTCLLSSKKQNGAHGKAAPFHCRVLCEVQFVVNICGTVCELFKNKSVSEKLPARTAMQNIVEKWQQMGSVANKNYKYPKRVRTPENIARGQESLEQCLTKSQRRLSVQVRIKISSCRNVIKEYSHMYPYEFSVVHQLKPKDKVLRGQ